LCGIAESNRRHKKARQMPAQSITFVGHAASLFPNVRVMLSSSQTGMGRHTQPNKGDIHETAELFYRPD
jgi:hypothetical protein